MFINYYISLFLLFISYRRFQNGAKTRDMGDNGFSSDDDKSNDEGNDRSLKSKSGPANQLNSYRKDFLNPKKKFLILHPQFLKKNHTVQKIHLNILLDIAIMMLLDHYV